MGSSTLATLSQIARSCARTQSSFEIAGKRLGADVVNMHAATSSVKKGETLIDTAMTLNAMRPDLLVIRHGSSGAVKLLSRKVDGAVINAGDGTHEHPTQALLDALTIRLNEARARHKSHHPAMVLERRMDTVAGLRQRFEQAYATLEPNQRYAAQAVTTGIHVVKRGESLARIAKRYGVSTRELLAANDMANGNKLKAGSKLQVPIRGDSPAVDDVLVASTAVSDARPVRVKAAPPASSSASTEHRTHRVRSGQTLGAIAMRYSTSIKKIRELNGLAESDVLRAGATIKVPRS